MSRPRDEWSWVEGCGAVEPVRRSGCVGGGLALRRCCPAACCRLHAQLFGGDETARKQIAEQGRRVDAIKQQNDELATRLSRIEESLKQLTASGPALELAQQLELLRQEVKQMRGQIEVLGNEVQMSAKRQRDMYVDLDSRLKRFEQTGAPPAAAAPGSPAAPTMPGTPPASAGAPPPAAPGAPPAVVAGAVPPGQAANAPSPAESSAYAVAQEQRRIGNYPGAIAGFQSFIAQYPKSQLAARAQYLDRRFVLQPARLPQRDREPAQADRNLPRQRDDTGCAAQHRELPDRAGRQRRRAQDHGRPRLALSGQ